MFEIYQRPSRDLRNNYSEPAQIVRNQNDLIITNKGEIDLVLVNPADWEEFKAYRYNKYIIKKIKEVEAVTDDPTTWLSEDEFWEKAKKL